MINLELGSQRPNTEEIDADIPEEHRDFDDVPVTSAKVSFKFAVQSKVTLLFRAQRLCLM